MKRYHLRRQVLGLILSFFVINLFPQAFVEQTGFTLPGVSSSSIAWGDYDNDGYLDILLTGYTGQDISKIFRNKGDNTFEETAIALSGVSDGSAGWGDYNNDGYLDILLSGYCSGYGRISRIYKNNGNGTFAVQESINLTGVIGSSVAWGDYDNDGYLDILLTGFSYDGNVSKIYRNNGNNTFIEQKDITLTGVSSGSAAWGDYDNDGYLDILLTGTKNGSASGAISLIYHNDGDNTFTEQTDISLTGLYSGSVAWGDYDSDGYLDILLTGHDDSYTTISKIYHNDSGNTFTNLPGINLIGVQESSVAWGDYDNDGDLDILLTGSWYGGCVTKIYRNDESNIFTEETNASLAGVNNGSVAWGDYNKDGKLDILLTGTNNSNDKVSEIYRNQCETANSAPAPPAGLTSINTTDTSVVLQWNWVPGMSYNVRIGTSSGDSDVVAPMALTNTGLRLKPGMGNALTNTFFILRYPKKNQFFWSAQAIDNGFASSAFAGEQSLTFSSSIQASQVWADNVQGSSLTLNWRRGNGTTCAVFAKDGNSGTAEPIDGTSYTADNQFGVAGSRVGTSEWYCVYNGTGNSVNITGLEGLTDYIFQVIEYDTGPDYFDQNGQANPFVTQTAVFTEQTGINLPGFSRGSVAWGDYDNDNDHDLDILLTGYGIGGSKIFKNTGNNTFVEQSDIDNLPPMYDGSVAWGDYDNDGDLDILFTGSNNSIIYRQDGVNSFTEQGGISLIGVDKSSAAWSDFDNDGDLDIILAGSSGSGIITKIYRNNGNLTFTEQPGINLPGITEGSIACGDYDNDGYTDIILTGNNLSKIYRNNGNFTFTEQTGISLPGVQYSSIDWGDYDNDGYLDILLTGSTGSERISKIYRNNGDNTFTGQTGISLTGVQNGSGVWGDYDNDGDLDILLTGEAIGGIISKIYSNNSPVNTFSEQTRINLTGVKYSSVVWGDYDKDGDLDILLTGEESGYSSTKISKIYSNDIQTIKVPPSSPQGLETLKSIENTVLSWDPVTKDGTPVKGLSYNIRVGTSSGGSEIKTAMASGLGIRNIPAMGNCYLNTFFILKSLLPGTYDWSVQAIDNGFAGGEFASDDNPLIIDYIQASKLEAKILSNSNSSLTLKWKKGNGQRRVVFCKQASTGLANPADNATYTPDPIFGYGDEIGTSGWYSIYNGRGDSTIVYGLTSGVAYSFQVIEYIGSTGSEVYYRTAGDANPGIFSSGLFSEQSDIGLDYGVDHSSVAWGDYDNDGYLDILLTGNGLSRIFRNNGDNTFTIQNEISLENVNYCSASWGDYDNDGKLDILLTGYTSGSVISKIYHNNHPLNTFTEQTGINLSGVRNGSAPWGDYDNDGYLDILLSGQPNPYTYERVSTIYHNNDGNSFSVQTGTDLAQVNSSSSAWGDYDNDGYLDFLLTGSSYDGPVSKIYCNKGDNTFEQTDISLIGVYDGSVAWGDYDNDGDLDILSAGHANSGYITLIYRNDGNNTFTGQEDISLTGVHEGSVAWGDYDNDGDLDILMTGGYDDGGTNYCITKIYCNNADNTFTEQTDINLIGVSGSSAAWGDYDNDGDLDILLTGRDAGGTRISKIFRNNTIMKAGNYASNQKPAAPGNLLATPQPDGINLSWSPVISDETSYKTMTYNLRAGTVPGGSNTCPSNSDNSYDPVWSGYRRLVATGNAQLNNTYLLKTLPSGTYHWSVQAVDQGFMGGYWATEGSFEVKNVQTFFSSDEVCLGFPTHFTDQSVVAAGIASWKWDFNDGETSFVPDPTHNYAADGTFNVKLVITDNSGAKDSLIQAVIVKSKPVANFSAPDVCQGTAATITNTTDKNGLTVISWYWDFGDGQISLAEQPAAHGYLGAADYTVALKALADNGCMDTITKTVTIASYPVAAVTANAPLTFCKGDSVTLTVPYNADYLYTWKNDGISITGADSSRYVAKLTGSFVAEVTNSKGNCKTTSSAVSIVAQNAPAAPSITYSGNLTFCQGDSINLSVANTTGYSYQWKLNGGAVGINLNQYIVKTSGTYTLVVANSTGCSVPSTNSVTVTVNPLPVVGALGLEGKKKFCSGESAILSIPATTGYIYSWKNSDGIIGGATANSYTVTSSGEYKLQVSNASGCKVTTEAVTIEVSEKPLKPSIDKSGYTKGMCLGESPLKLSVDDVISGYNYRWYKNEAPLSDQTSIEVFEEGNYYLEASIDICTSNRDSVNIDFMESLPKPDIIARGPTVWLLATTSKAAKYRWYYNGSLIPDATGSTYVAGQNLGIYRLSISNDNQCFAFSDTIRIPTGATGFEDVDQFADVNIYPNPTTGLFTIKINNNVFGELVIDIFTQNGSKALNIKFEKTTEHFSSQIDLSGQSKGMYLINLSIDKYIATRKILIE